ncbi:hypothetical protein MMC31_004109 [Peltigera leucophlebia]|nr:hypothetical protein [Peltigera leucophlebia]
MVPPTQSKSDIILTSSFPAPAITTTIKPTTTQINLLPVTTMGPQTYTVEVGKRSFQFVPDTIQATVGDTVEFEFFPANHSVARAEYQHPCVPYELSGQGKVGFFSGFKPVERVLLDPPKFSLLINDTLPIFFYCSAVGSCIKNQMVGVINPNSSVSLEVQRAAAKISDFMVIPGQGFPTEEDHSSTTAEGGSSSSTLLSTADVDDTPRTTAQLSPGAIAAIAIASVLFALILSSVMFLLSRHSRILRTLQHRRPSVQTNIVQAEAKEPENRYINSTLIPPRGGEIGYWTSYGLPAPPFAPGYNPTSIYYHYKSPTDFQSSSASIPNRSNSNSSPPLPPPFGVDQLHELPASEPKGRGGFNVDWSAYDERLSLPPI